MANNQSRVNSIDRRLLIFAGVCLLLSAASHFAFYALKLADRYPNTVFLFLANEMVCLVAGILGAAAGLTRLKSSGV